MRIEVTAKGMDVSDDILRVCQDKGEKLLKYFDRTQLITYRIEKHSERRYGVECLVDVELHSDFIGQSEHEELLSAIDESTSKAQRQLRDFKEKLKDDRHR